MKTKQYVWAILLGGCLMGGGCRQQTGISHNETETFTNPLLPTGKDPYATFHNGKYYYTQTQDLWIELWETDNLTDLQHATHKPIAYTPSEQDRLNIWNPEIHRINGKWYIYYAADNGNTDNHQIFVLENDSPTPMEGTFIQKGPIRTNDTWNWGIHPTVFSHQGSLYLLWSGWPQRRILEETQCIYIARLKDPWTLDGERILLSHPEYDWERQWINPDGGRTAYPVYVNEAPQFFHSKDGKKLIIYYSASGCWTPYYSVGMLTASADADLLDPKSWTKCAEPVFHLMPQDSVWGPGSPCVVPSPDESEWYILYHARPLPYSQTGGGGGHRSPRLKKIDWDEQGMPVLGNPTSTRQRLPKPSHRNSLSEQ